MGCEASTEVGNVEPLGHVCRWKKQHKNEPREGRPASYKTRTGSTTGDPWGQVQPCKKKRGSSGNGRWAGGPERRRWNGTSRALNRKPMVNNVDPKYRNTLRETYAGDQYDASGRQCVTLILSMGPTRAINGTPKVDNVRSRHSSNSLTAPLPESSAQRKPCKNKYAKIQERRRRKGNMSSDENNNAGRMHDATKRLRRGEKDTMEAVIMTYQTITARPYVRNVD